MASEGFCELGVGEEEVVSTLIELEATRDEEAEQLFEFTGMGDDKVSLGRTQYPG